MWEDSEEIYVSSSDRRVDQWGDCGELYITPSTWRLDCVGELVRIVHYLKYLDTRLGGRIGDNFTLPQVPGDRTIWEDWEELYITSTT